MDGNSVQQIERIIQEGLVVEVGGDSFSAKGLIPVRDRSQIECIELSTLTGLKDYIQGNLDALVKAQMFIVVKSFEEVNLLLAADSKTKIRQNPVTVKLDRQGKTFPFGQFLEVDDFIIKISTLFQDTEDLVKIRQYVSRLTVTDSIQTEDDGVSQSANIKKGISGALSDVKLAPLGLKLKPWRTFVEVEQPESSFIFRMKLYGDKVPACAILESDGGAWKSSAVKSIKDWLGKNIKGINIIA